MKKTHAVLLSLCLIAIGCADDPVSTPALDPGLAMDVAIQSRAWAPAMPTREPFVRACDQGGRMIIEGSTSVTEEGATRIHTWDQVLRHENCTMQLRQGSVTANGESRLTGEVHFSRKDGKSELLFQTSRQIGTLTLSRDERTLTCETDLTTTFDRTTRTYHITGTSCGRTIDRTLPIPDRP